MAKYTLFIRAAVMKARELRIQKLTPTQRAAHLSAIRSNPSASDTDTGA